MAIAISASLAGCSWINGGSVAPISLGTEAEVDPSYKINPGDVLQVSVWREEELDRQVLVLPDGTIAFPLAGQVAAAGHTVDEVRDALVRQMNEFIPDPVITVSVLNAAGNKIYVTGEVNRPGEYQAERRITVMQAITLAGGITPFGEEDDIIILRQLDDREIAIPFDYSEVKRGKNLDQNIVLHSGDVIVVPETGIF